MTDKVPSGTLDTAYSFTYYDLYLPTVLRTKTMTVHMQWLFSIQTNISQIISHYRSATEVTGVV